MLCTCFICCLTATCKLQALTLDRMGKCFGSPLAAANKPATTLRWGEGGKTNAQTLNGTSSFASVYGYPPPVQGSTNSFKSASCGLASAQTCFDKAMSAWTWHGQGFGRAWWRQDSAREASDFPMRHNIEIAYLCFVLHYYNTPSLLLREGEAICFSPVIF